MGLLEKSSFLAAARVRSSGSLLNSAAAILTAFYASRLLHNADFSAPGLPATDAATALTPDHALHNAPAADDSGRGHGIDGALADAALSNETDGGWGHVVASGDSFRFDLGEHGAQGVSTGAGGAHAAADDVATLFDAFSNDALVNDAPVTVEVTGSGGGAVSFPHGTGGLLVADGAGTHADQTAAFDANGAATAAAPAGATAFAGTLASGIVDFGGTQFSPQAPVAALPVASDGPTALLSGPYISDGVTYDPAGTFASAPGTHASVNAGGATAAQLLQALDDSGLSVNGSGIKVGVLSDSFNDLGGAAADEADGALPPAADIDVIKDLPSGGTDEGRAMMQIIHDIAPGASLAFYTAFESEQDFANGILALAAAGCKVIVDDVSYFDEPFFQNGVVAQAIQTVEAEGVVFVTAAGNDASDGYQAAFTPISGTYDGVKLTDAESFGGSLVQTVTIGANSSYEVPLLLEWNQAYGDATSDLEILVFENGRLVGEATNQSDGEPTNPWVGIDLRGGATYQIAIENLSGPNPGLIKEIAEGDGIPVTIGGADVGTVYGHAMTPGAITAGAVSAADTPAFGFSTPVSESFSSSGAGTELLFANNGTPLSSPEELSPVAVSGVDDIATTVSDIGDFYGTSAAAASLAGVAALILSADPSLTPAQVEQIMEQTALPMANSAVSGAGLVQVDPAVADAISDASSAPATPPVPTVTSDTVSGSGISSGAGTLELGQTAVLTLTMSEAVVVSGGTPSLSLNDGGTAIYNAAASTGTSLVFDYTVTAGQYSSALAVTGVNLNGATIASTAGVAANLSGADTTFSKLLVDATTPVVTPAHSHDTLLGSVSVSHAQAATSGVLAGDTDADPSDTLSVSAVNGSAANVGHSVTGAYGTLTLNSDGSYTYSNTNFSAVTAAGGVAEDIFNYTVSNGHGGTANSTLTVLITSPSDIYVTGAHGSTITGGSGSYVLDGSAGDMTVTAGNSGSQWLVGGPGDTLTGGNSADTFMFAPGFGNETINNFNTANDVIDLPQSEFANFAAVQADMHASGANTIIELDANDVITLTHVAIANLHAQNFHFVA